MADQRTPACIVVRCALGAWMIFLTGCATTDSKLCLLPWRKAQIETIDRTAAMAGNHAAQALAKKAGLNIVNLTWEDTGRYKNSAVGPNISDMTIQVQRPSGIPFGHGEPRAMPVLREPNFSDKTADLDPRDFTLLVGNEKGQTLRRISLRDFLERPLDFLSRPESWKAEKKTLLATRDSRVLVSAQACFLPVPRHGTAMFNPVLFNYQSVEDDPAVLAVLCTREGTSATVIDNVRDAYSWGQRLYFNQGGQRASLTGTRKSEYAVDPAPDRTAEAAGESGLNMVLLIQIPLHQHRPQSPPGPVPAGEMKEMMEAVSEAASDVEEAVIGHGRTLGPFVEIDDLKIRRDERFPVRVTVQFYQATSNGIVSAADIDRLSAQIKRVYSRADVVGSLVTGGKTGRVTEYDGVKVQSPNWWGEFWQRHSKNTGQTPTKARARLQRLLGVKDVETVPVCELYLRDLLRL